MVGADSVGDLDEQGELSQGVVVLPGESLHDRGGLEGERLPGWVSDVMGDQL